jgi:hypothetical protein
MVVAPLQKKWDLSVGPIGPALGAGRPTHALCLREVVIEVSARGCHLGHED